MKTGSLHGVYQSTMPHKRYILKAELKKVQTLETRYSNVSVHISLQLPEVIWLVWQTFVMDTPHHTSWKGVHLYHCIDPYVNIAYIQIHDILCLHSLLASVQDIMHSLCFTVEHGGIWACAPD